MKAWENEQELAKEEFFNLLEEAADIGVPEVQKKGDYFQVSPEVHNPQDYINSRRVLADLIKKRKAEIESQRQERERLPIADPVGSLMDQLLRGEISYATQAIDTSTEPPSPRDQKLAKKITILNTNEGNCIHS